MSALVLGLGAERIDERRGGESIFCLAVRRARRSRLPLEARRVRRRVDLLQLQDRDVGVDLRRAEIGVPKERLDEAQRLVMQMLDGVLAQSGRNA